MFLVLFQLNDVLVFMENFYVFIHRNYFPCRSLILVGTMFFFLLSKLRSFTEMEKYIFTDFSLYN